MTEPTLGPVADGLVTLASRHSVDDTVVNIVSLLREKKIKLFAVIDHSGEAKAAGLTMPPTRVVIFGNPRGGTPLMLASPGTAIDLPLKLLVAEDAQGRVWISYNSAEYLGRRHGLPEGLLASIAGIAGIAEQASE